MDNISKLLENKKDSKEYRGFIIKLLSNKTYCKRIKDAKDV